MANITELHNIPGVTYNMPSSSSTFSAGTIGITYFYLPVDAEIDLEITSSNNSLIYNPHMPSTGITGGGIYSGYAYINYVLDVSKTVTGSSVITAVDRNTGLEVSRRIYKVPSAATPNLFISPSAYTFASGASFDEPRPGVALTDIIETDCTLDPDTTGDQFGHVAWSVANGNNYWPNMSQECSVRPNALTKKLQATRIVPNTGDTRWVIGDTVFNDTSGNSYLTSFKISQEAGSGTTPASNIYCGWASAWTPDTPCNGFSDYDAQLYVEGCTLDGFSYMFQIISGDSSFTCDVARTHSTQNWEPLGGIRARVSGNTTNETRVGYLYVTFRDTDQNLYNQRMIITQAPCGSGPIPSDSYIRFVDSAVTTNGGSGVVSCPLDYSGCTPYGGSKAFSATGTLDVTGVSVLHGYDSVTCSISFPSNTGSTSLQADVRVEFDDTSGNTYYDTIRITQGIQHDVNFNPSTYEIQGQANRVTSTAVPLNCTISSITFSAITYTSGTWDEYPTYTINGNDVTFRVPANDTNAMRILIYNFNITDTDGNVYNKSITIVQMVQNRLVYLDPTGRTISASGYGTYDFNIKGSGCSIDSSYTPTFTFSGDTSWINSISSVTFNDSVGRWYVSYYSPRNLGDSSREVYITVNGVHDTDGNVYNGLVYKATQNYGSYVFLNYDKEHNAPSGSSVETIEVVPVNTTVCSISVTSASSTPTLWTGVTQPTVTVLGNYITVNWPQNPHTSERNLQLTVEVVWGESCENTTTLSFNKYQNGAQTPVQKDIKAADAEYSVGSGSGNASTTIQTSGCTYDHFTYITGGSFSVTATSGPDNTIVFTYPENPTTTARTGYVYITFYDTDGNTYGPQTITFTQQAGSSPGPGPEPETGYVLTTLTISDQEQHRYFVEARPGVVYSAAGQYYKTVLACEARYSLYYVNSYGGVDVLPFKEKGWKKSDTVTRFNYSRSFRNNTLEFENVNYMNEIKASWELHTGWMSDESSQRMHELVESTIVYLYDAEEKTYTPVVMTDKKLEYKTYHNQGRKFYNYTVNVEESQSKERR